MAEQNRQQPEAATETRVVSEFERLIGEPVSARNYVPKMELTARQQRSLPDVRRRLLEESRMMGEAAYYGWGAGKDKIEGPSVKLAMAAARCWGNCSVEAMPLQETHDAYVFTSRFIDLETGYTLERQFRQSKAWMVYGKHDAERKADIRFQIGQSKAARNLVLNALPEWLIDEALEEAKQGCRERVEKYVADNGIVKAVDMCLAALLKAGVKEDAVLAKCVKAARNGLVVDDLVMLRGCLKAIQDGAERAEDLFPSSETRPVGPSAKERAKTLAQVGDQKPAPESAGDSEAADAAKYLADQTPPGEFDPIADMRAAIALLTEPSAAVSLAEECENLGLTAELDAKCRAMQAQSKAGGKSKQRSLPGE